MLKVFPLRVVRSIFRPLLAATLLVGALFVSAFDLSPAAAATPKEIKEVAGELVCLCGNCNRESLATCICSDFAVPERQAIGRRLDQGQTKEQIIEAYVADYGEMALAVPPATGFNILAWITPFALLLGGVFLVRRVLLGWRRPTDKTDETPPSPAHPDPLDKERQRLEKDLEGFED
jgi:cytochrome c-type biogenesis protein CcmH